MVLTHTTHLYGCEMWADALKKEKDGWQMVSVQQRGGLGVACSYRVRCVVIPIDLMALERKHVYKLKLDTGGGVSMVEARNQTTYRWQSRRTTKLEANEVTRLVESCLLYTSRCV